jgi:hypothetical protein
VLKYKWKKKEQFVALVTDCVIHRRFNLACNRMLKYRIIFFYLTSLIILVIGEGYKFWSSTGHTEISSRIQQVSVSIFAIATRLWTGRSGDEGSIPGRGEGFLSSPQPPDQPWAPPAFHSVDTRGYFPAHKVAKARQAITHLHPALRLGMRGAVPPDPIRHDIESTENLPLPTISQT